MSPTVPLLVLVLCGLSIAQNHTQIQVFNLRATGLPQDILGITDGYVKVFCRFFFVGKTSVRNNNANPWWKEEFTFYNAKENATLKLEVHDEDVFFDDLVGTCQTKIRAGTHQEKCALDKGGMLFYEYTLS